MKEHTQREREGKTEKERERESERETTGGFRQYQKAATALTHERPERNIRINGNYCSTIEAFLVVFVLTELLYHLLSPLYCG